MTGRQTIIPVPSLTPRVRHRALFGSHAVDHGTTAGRFLKVQLKIETVTEPSPRAYLYSIGFRVGFQAVKPDTANPELELFGGAGNHASGRASLVGMEWGWRPMMLGTEISLHRSRSRDGGHEHDGNLFINLLRGGCRRKYRYRHPHRHGGRHHRAGILPCKVMPI